MSLVAVVLLVAAGYYPARLLTGARYAAVLVAPIVAALIVTLFGMSCLVLRLPIGVAVGLTAACAVGCATAVHRRAPAPLAGGVDTPWVLLLPLGGLIPYLTVVRAPVEWDPRSIWWFHARWWAEGGTALVRAMQNPSFAFSHSDYPPLAPATIGALWSVLGTRSLAQAQVVTAVLGLSATATLGYALWRLFADRLPRAWVTVAAGVVVAAAYGVARVDAGTNGYVDYLWGVTFAAAAVFLLASPMSDAALRWGTILLAATALTKNEALIAAVALGGLTVLRYGRARRAVVWMAVGLAPGAVWMIVARVVGAQSEDRWKVTALARLDPDVTARIGPSIDAVQHELAALAVATLLVTMIGMQCARSTRRSVGGSAFPWMWCAWAGTVVPLVLAYVVSNRDLRWHLSSSVTRTTIAPNLVLLAEVSIWTLTLVLARRGTSRPRDVAVREATGLPEGLRSM